MGQRRKIKAGPAGVEGDWDCSVVGELDKEPNCSPPCGAQNEKWQYAGVGGSLDQISKKVYVSQLFNMELKGSGNPFTLTKILDPFTQKNTHV